MTTPSLTVPASLDMLEAIAAFVLQAAAAAGLDAQQTYHLRLAVDEMSTNLVQHGCPPNRPQTLRLTAELTPTRLAIRLFDSGAPWDPRCYPPPTNLRTALHHREPGGLGVFLALHCLDDFDYAQLPDGNCSTFIMHRQPTSDV